MWLRPYSPLTEALQVDKDRAGLELLLAKPGLRVRGRLVDEKGQPVPAARAELDLPADSPPPPLELRLAAPSTTSGERGAISGVVRMPDGSTPAHLAMVFPFREGEAEGRFRLDRQRVGEHGLVVTFPGAASTIRTSVRVETEKVTTMPVQLVVGGSVVGRAKDQNGRPLAADAYITILRPQPGWPRPFPTRTHSFPGTLAGKVSPDGRFAIHSVPPGTYTAAVWRDRRVTPVEGSVVVTDERETKADLQLPVEAPRPGADPPPGVG